VRVLVTGGSGFLGSHVAEQLSKAGHTVRALVRRTSNRKFLSTLPGIEFAEGSVEDAAKVEDAMKGGVDAVIHAAAIVKGRNEAEFVEANVTGTRNMLDAVEKHAPNLKRFVYISSLELCGPAKDGLPVALTSECPITAYGRSKLEAERLVKARKEKIPSTILRPTAVYGPRDNEIVDVFRSVKRGVLPISGDGTVKLTFVYGPDCAAACVRAIDAKVPSGSIYFVSDGQIYVWREAVEDVERALGRRAIVRVGLPFAVLDAVAVGVEAYGKFRNKAVMLTREKVNVIRQSWVCGIEETVRDLGWKPEVLWREGTKLTADWYRREGWI
jgi:nucleoside-diphosphate-sugar epimerase